MKDLDSVDRTDSMILLRAAEKADPTLSVCLGFVLIAAIGLLDYLTGCELSFSLFYFLPLGLVAWKGRRWLGIMAAFVCVVAWFAANGAAGRALSNPFAIYWNISARFLSLVMFRES